MFDLAAPDLAGLDLPVADAGRTLPGAALIAQLDALDPTALSSDAEVLDLAAAWDRVATWALARSVAVTAEFARRPADSRLGEPGAARGPLGSVVRSHADDELAVRIGSSRRSVAWRLEAASQLLTMPGTAAAFATGRLDAAKARVMVEECRVAGPAAIATIESTVLGERAFAQPTARLRERVRRAVIAADPEAAADRSERARDGRLMAVTPLPDAMAEVVATLPAEDATAIRTAVDAAARRLRDRPGEERTMDQLRADCLAAPFWNALRTGVLDGTEPVALGEYRGESAAVGVTVPAAVLLGLSDRPGELAGYGPVPAPVARRLASDGRWRRLLTDEAGALVSIGTRSYRPSAVVQRQVTVRDGRCRFPGCSAAAIRCDLDHIVAFPEGLTEPANLVSLCRRHHLLKHGGRGDEGGAGDRATPTRRDDGSILWRLPDGRAAVSHPAEIGDPEADRAWHAATGPDDDEAPPGDPPHP
jgi:hypothetical protein